MTRHGPNGGGATCGHGAIRGRGAACCHGASCKCGASCERGANCGRGEVADRVPEDGVAYLGVLVSGTPQARCRGQGGVGRGVLPSRSVRDEAGHPFAHRNLLEIHCACLGQDGRKVGQGLGNVVPLRLANGESRPAMAVSGTRSSKILPRFDRALHNGVASPVPGHRPPAAVTRVAWVEGFCFPGGFGTRPAFLLARRTLPEVHLRLAGGRRGGRSGKASAAGCPWVWQRGKVGP